MFTLHHTEMLDNILLEDLANDKFAENVKKGYKVVFVAGNSYWSAICGNGVKEYFINEWIASDEELHGPLAVFDEIKNAIIFSHIFAPNTYCIFSCEYQVSENCSLWAPGETTHISNLPSGTRLAKSVKLVAKCK